MNSRVVSQVEIDFGEEFSIKRQPSGQAKAAEHPTGSCHLCDKEMPLSCSLPIGLDGMDYKLDEKKAHYALAVG